LPSKALIEVAGRFAHLTAAGSDPAGIRAAGRRASAAPVT
jgi:hypothetical protein